MNYRNKRILAEARQHSCQGCGDDDGTVVAAHSNQGRHGKGMGIKAHDCFVAYLCHQCHTFVDQSRALQGEKTAYWEMAHKKTVPLFSHLLDDEGRVLMERTES